MMNHIKVSAKLNFKDGFAYRNRLLLGKSEYGFMFCMSIMGLISYSAVLISTGFSGIAVVEHFEKYKIPTLAICGFTIMIATQVYRNYVSAQHEFNGINSKEVEYLFSNFGISASMTDELNFSWNSILQIEENRDRLYVFIKENKAMIIPKRDFQSREEIERVKELMIKKVDKKKLKLRRNS